MSVLDSSLGFVPDEEEWWHDELVVRHESGRYLWDDLAGALDGTSKPPEPCLLYREDGRGLLYPRRVNLVFAADSEGKTWIALVAATAVIAAGGLVMHFDYDDTAITNVERLVQLGCDRAAIRANYRHRTEPGRITRADVDAIVAEITNAVATGRTVLVIVDVIADAMVAHDLDENAAAEYVKWLSTVVQPMVRAGSSIVLNDHVIKPGGRANGGFSRGTGAKRAKVDGVAYEITAPVPLTREHGGTLELTIWKDHHGQIGRRSETIARILFTPNDDRLDVRIVEPTPGARVDTPTLTRAAIDATKHATGPLSQTALEKRMSANGLKANAKAKREAIAIAIAAGAIRTEPGARSAVNHFYVHDLQERPEPAPTDRV